MDKNLGTILETLKSITDDELNFQIDPSKRTIGEIVSHVLSTTRIFFLGKVFGVFFKKTIKQALTHPVDASDFHWQPTTAKKRKPKSFKRQELIYKVENRRPKIMKRYHAADKVTDLLHYETWHVSCHTRQIQTIVQALKSEQ